MIEWQLWQDGPGDGAWNMALDQALAEAVRDQGHPPVLRFYRWAAPTLSLGRFQRPERDLDAPRLRRHLAEDGWQLVRRLTGGGALLHHKEETYALACRQEHLGALNVKESYEALCAFLIGAYRRFGLEASFAALSRADDPSLGAKTALCFAGHEEYDVTVGGRKLGGNAQRRWHDTVFQHGSIPYEVDWSALGALQTAAAPPPAQGALGLVQAGWTGAPLDLIEALKAAFESSRQVRLVPSEPEPSLRHRAEHLKNTLYAQDSWTWQGRSASGLA